MNHICILEALSFGEKFVRKAFRVIEPSIDRRLHRAKQGSVPPGAEVSWVLDQPAEDVDFAIEILALGRLQQGDDPEDPADE